MISGEVNDEPIEYEQWDLTQPLIRPPSRLYHLKPINIDSPFRESLTGYLTRLAEAHCVSVNNLYWKAISYYNSNRYIFDNAKKEKKKHSHLPHEINGTGIMAMGIVKGLEKQTLIKGLDRLTFLSWSEVFQVDPLLSRYQSWCPFCYQQWRERGEPIYYPLQWALQVITGCVIHQCRLSFSCLYCNQKIVYLINRSRIGYCCWCGNWLGIKETDTPKFNRTLSIREFRWECWVSENIGKLISVRLPLRSEAYLRLFRHAMQECIKRVAKGNKQEFAYIIGEYQSTVDRMIKTKWLPSLRRLLKLGYCLGISLLDLLTGRLPQQFLIRPLSLKGR